jgi:NAD(P)H-hydrate epimerase
VVHHGHALTQQSGRAGLAEAVAAARTEGLDQRTAALCAYARKLTHAPALVAEADVAALRAAGLDDRAIVDANQVVAYFNYVNRIVEGLGVQLEERWPTEVRSRRRYVPDQLGAEIPTLDAAALPWVSVAQMREVDRLLVDRLRISLERLMENAGRNLALLARLLLGGDARGRTVSVLAGPGGNGGGAMVAARHLAVAGARVGVLLARPPERLAPVTARQHEILRRMGLTIQVYGTTLGPADLVVDGLLGYSQSGPPSGRTARLIQVSAGRRILALDVPSGLELSTGRLHRPHVVATATLTLAAPKHGLRAPGAAGAVGALYLADISVPPVVWARLGLALPSPFGTHTIVRVGAGGGGPSGRGRETG